MQTSVGNFAKILIIFDAGTTIYRAAAEIISADERKLPFYEIINTFLPNGA